MTPDLSNSKAVTAREEGAVLLLVILILTLISVLVLSWAQEWRTELKLASNFGEAHKCQRLAEAGIYYALGKLVTAKTAELSGMNSVTPQIQGDSSALWQGDQQPHVLELPDGMAEIRIGDEGGKISLNQASEPLLHNFFTVLGLPEPQVRTMVDSIQDWRTRDSYPRLYGAKNAYYLGLDPPYVAKNGKFETVEELAWVRGFEASPLIPQLSRWLTVHSTGGGINLNTAPLEVLLAMGFARDNALNIIATRQAMPLRNFQEIAQTGVNPVLGQGAQMSFRSSSFFTIISTGMVKKNSGRQTIRATVRLNTNQPVPWAFISWYGGFPG
ncbi:MAG: type II secretion system protein GspK [Deltaproteobacteria bacterium]|nr:type II secretion system protein GspK [Deltaproteobacteria bacterium]